MDDGKVLFPLDQRLQPEHMLWHPRPCQSQVSSRLASRKTRIGNPLTATGGDPAFSL
ncbi:rCG33359 [Rattus norvegicus]|uniref:RCG33359 n=1 Tax=Rattus norvegicus TaxID=10116 RepID=A6HGV9_RAT|nr:rCG33359 [Rattus norvegicus]